MTDTTYPTKPVAWTSKLQLGEVSKYGIGFIYDGEGKPTRANVPLYDASLLSEYERVKARLDFHMTDASRMFSKEEASGVCPTLELCFEYGDRVRCGPCAVKASKAVGIEIDDTHSHLPEVCKLRREVKAETARSEALEAENKRLREASKAAYLGLRVLKTMCRKAALQGGVEATESALKGLVEAMPELPALSALRPIPSLEASSCE